MTIVGKGLGVGSVGSLVLSGLGSDVVSGEIRVPVCQVPEVTERRIDANVAEHTINAIGADFIFDIIDVDHKIDIVSAEFGFEVYIICEPREPDEG